MEQAADAYRLVVHIFRLGPQPLEMLQPERAGTTATGDKAVGNVVGPFIFNDYFIQITIENFALFPIGWGMDNRGVDKGMITAAFHGKGNAGNGKGVTVPEQWAVAAFTDPKGFFGKTHGSAWFGLLLLFH